jgi:hypothetical protein
LFAKTPGASSICTMQCNAYEWGRGKNLENLHFYVLVCIYNVAKKWLAVKWDNILEFLRQVK